MNIEQVDPKNLLAAVEGGTVFIDVREPYEIDEVSYDVPGQKQIPMGEIQVRMSEIPKDVDVVIGCRSGGRSMNVCQFLVMQGFTNIKNLDGGIMKWVESGLPTK